MGAESSSMDIQDPLLSEYQKDPSPKSESIPEWKDQITITGLAVSAVLGSLLCIITHNLNLTVGIVPSLNIAAGLLGFFFVKTWNGFLSKLGLSTKPLPDKRIPLFRRVLLLVMASLTAVSLFHFFLVYVFDCAVGSKGCCI